MYEGRKHVDDKMEAVASSETSEGTEYTASIFNIHERRLRLTCDITRPYCFQFPAAHDVWEGTRRAVHYFSRVTQCFADPQYELRTS